MESRENNGPYNIFTETEITVEFFDLDLMNVVYHGNYFNYFEMGRRALLEKIDFNYYEMQESGYAFPVIDVSVKYPGSLRFMDRAVVKTVLLEYENRLKLRYEIRNSKTGLLTTKGVSTQMAFNMRTGESCFICPEILVKKVEKLLGKNA